MIGIDLGTTHTLLAYADTGSKGEQDVELFEIEQLVAPGEVAPRALLPSLRYHPASAELSEGDLRLPWVLSDPAGVQPLVLGDLARELGSRVPGRLVASAKSWLSHSAVDRTAPILPWGGVEDVTKVSPTEASASYLSYLRDAWNHRFGEHRLEHQEVVLTVPASFDESARALTVEAARMAGLERFRLLEEPQAACYDWIHRHRGTLSEALADVTLLLVVDIGGGTTDLTLISVNGHAEEPALERIGVGDHLMLGGDNMDMAVARLIERRIGGARLTAATLSQLLQQCRAAKERLLDPEAPETTTVTLVGGGSRLVGGARSAELSREEVNTMIVDGFFPGVSVDEHPHRRRSAIVEFGLPYAADAAVTRHIAAFLTQHPQSSSASVAPDAVLLNGGVFNSEALTRRLLDVLEGWRGGPVRQLRNPDPMAAVARGAVAYAMARHGDNPRIGGGSARSYFLVLEGEADQQQGVCLLPRGSVVEGEEILLEGRNFSLRLGEPVRFHLVSSTSDRDHNPGDLVALNEVDFVHLPPIASVLSRGERADEVAVQLGLTLTEIGTLDMSCVAVDGSKRRWHLAFQLRGKPMSQLDQEKHPRFAEAADLIGRLYGTRSKSVGPKEIRSLRTNLERILGSRDSWQTPLLRQLSAELLQRARRRRRSAYHERLWLSLVGFCLRPGFGYPLDDWRVRELWGIYDQGLQYDDDAQNWAEWWTLWRRVSGGLDESAQARLLDDVVDEMKPPRGKTRKSYKSPRRRSDDDMIRLVGSLERLPAKRKTSVGQDLLERLRDKGEPDQIWWAVGRLGGRVPFVGSVHNVVPREVAERWIEEALRLDWKGSQTLPFAAALLARLSGDRERDVSPVLRGSVVERLQTQVVPARWVEMVEKVVEFDAADEQRAFGESLPPGLRLID